MILLNFDIRIMKYSKRNFEEVCRLLLDWLIISSENLPLSSLTFSQNKDLYSMVYIFPIRLINIILYVPADLTGKKDSRTNYYFSNMKT